MFKFGMHTSAGISASRSSEQSPTQKAYCDVGAVFVLNFHVCCQPDLVVDSMLLLP